MKNPIKWLQDLRTKREMQSSAHDELERVRRLGRQQEYKNAVIEVFRALAHVMNMTMELKRAPPVTAREFRDASLERIVEKGVRPEFFRKLNPQERRAFVMEKTPDPIKSAFETIVDNFEIARYSPEEVSFEQFQQSMQSLEAIFNHITARKAGPPKKPRRRKPKSRPDKKRRKPSKERKPAPKERQRRRKPAPRAEPPKTEVPAAKIEGEGAEQQKAPSQRTPRRRPTRTAEPEEES